MIENRVKTVADSKGKNVRQICLETGIAYNTVLHLFRKSATRIDLKTIDALCRVLECQPGDLFAWMPDESLD